MSDELWFRFFPSKFMAGIRGLNANEVKLYTCIMCRIYEHSGPIKNNPDVLATYAEMRPSTFNKTFARLLVLEKIFITENGMISNAACDAEISRRESKVDFAKRAGKKSAEKRQQNQSETPTDAQRTLNYKRREEKSPPISPTGGGDVLQLQPTDEPSKAPDRFEEFWSRYPHRNGVKKGKAVARTKWVRIVKDGVPPDEILKGVAASLQSPDVKRGYARDPSTWLNQRGWEDDIPAGGGGSPVNQQRSQGDGGYSLDGRVAALLANGRGRR